MLHKYIVMIRSLFATCLNGLNAKQKLRFQSETIQYGFSPSPFLFPLIFITVIVYLSF